MDRQNESNQSNAPTPKDRSRVNEMNMGNPSSPMPSENEDEDMRDKNVDLAESQRSPEGQPATPPATVRTLEIQVSRDSRPQSVDHDRSEDDVDSQGEDVDPASKIPDFDWGSLTSRYHDAMKKKQEEENELFKEYDKLLKFYYRWVAVSSNYEVDRTFKRLKTRMAHVQHSEQELEEKRKHYEKVVKAFENALHFLSHRGGQAVPHTAMSKAKRRQHSSNSIRGQAGGPVGAGLLAADLAYATYPHILRCHVL